MSIEQSPYAVRLDARRRWRSRAGLAVAVVALEAGYAAQPLGLGAARC